MRTTLFATITAAVALAAAPAFAQSTSSSAPHKASSPSGAGHRQAGAAGAKATSDEAFMKEAAIGGMAEVELGKLASDKASDAKVKALGARMVTDHSKANEELKALAAKKNVMLPTAVDAKHKATYDRLSKLSGAAFDSAYVSDMMSDHEADVAKFGAVAKNSADPDVKAWAEKTLPTLREHLTAVQDAKRSIDGKAVTHQ